jgi:hypothetical protein
LQSEFFNSQRHCAGVNATRLSAGIFPSLIKPITSMVCILNAAKKHGNAGILKCAAALTVK